MAIKHKKRSLIIIICSVLLVVVTAMALLFWHNSQSDHNNQRPSLSFSFNRASAPEWWSGGSTFRQPSDPIDTPEASILIFSGTKEQLGNCFVMAFYNKGSVNVENTLKQREIGLVRGEDATKLHRIASPLQTLKTPEGTKSYTLYQYNFDIPDVQQGNEFGFIPLKNGYVEVRGICPTSSLLHDTTVPLSALELLP